MAAVKVLSGITAVARRLRALAAALLLLSSVAVTVAVTAGPALAATGESDLCTGFSGCASAGYSNFGYSSVYGNSHWGQDAGHNCTNYVAYRFTAAGIARPSWLGLGNAVDWGLWAPSGIVNDTPSVGAIAWWGPSSAYAVYGGHVSIVQQVNADGSFIDSDDNYGGDFHWRKYTPGGSQWPTAFIHYDDAALGGSTGPVSIVAGNNNGQMTVQLVNFPLGTSYYFCHNDAASGYPTGGAIASHGSFTVSSPSQSWTSGLCSGTGNFWIGIQATDGNSYYGNQAVLGSPPAITTTGVPGGVLAKPYSAAIKADAGTASYRWSVASGALPEGLSLGPATGAITGTPKTAGAFTVVIRVTDADHDSATRKFSFTVAALAVRTTGLPAGTLREGYRATLVAWGGKAPLTWSISCAPRLPGVRDNEPTDRSRSTMSTSQAPAGIGFRVYPIPGYGRGAPGAR